MTSSESEQRRVEGKFQVEKCVFGELRGWEGSGKCRILAEMMGNDLEHVVEVVKR